jgi:hypothetical protein
MAAHACCDNDDDDDVDLSPYDVGVQPCSDSTGEGERASSPRSDDEPDGWPTVGERVRARYSEQSSTFRTARVVGLDIRARSVAVRFDGWGDVVDVPLARVEMTDRAPGRDACARSIRPSGRASPTYDDFPPPRPSDPPPACSRAAGASDAVDDLRGEELQMLNELKRARDDAGGELEEDQGRRLLLKMGWQPGAALGATFGRDRAARPVAESLPTQHDRRGLGAGRR